MIYLGLGSNLGDREGNLLRAVSMIAAVDGILICAQSNIYETEPVGGPPQSRYLNGVIGIETALSPETLLHECRKVENELGRIRNERWGPRTIDIDILLFDDAVIDTGELTIPHPHLHERGFVLVPLAQIAPHVRHPLLGVYAGDLLADIDTTGVRDTGMRL